MYVCLCKAVTDHDLREAIAAGASSAEELSERLGVGTCCGCCKEFTAEIVDEQLARSQTYAA